MPSLREDESLCRSGNKVSDEPIAIVGIGLRLPGDVRSTDEFWNMLISKTDGHGSIPPSRYNVEAFFDSSEAPKTGYFLQEDPAFFDASFFSITPQEAMRMDPQQRLLLEVVWECLENAGETNWKGSRIGCFTGVFGEDWLEMALKSGRKTERYHAVGTGEFALSNRISFEYDFKGPSMTIQTGCSSSLVGLHEACQALKLDHCSGAIVTGTNLIWTPTMTATMHANTVLSPSGLCRTFDAKADGYGRGEAINALYIKRLSHALRDNDPIRAVIRGTATNSDGKTQNISQPCPLSQERLIRKAYHNAQIDDIKRTGFFECHGTATRAGDLVETSVVGHIFDEGVIIGGVKPNIGHSEGASGISSVIKAVMSLEHKTVPPNSHFDVLNPEIATGGLKLKVPTESIPWPEDKHERVSINCFGIGGSNAHAVVDSAAAFMPESPDHFTTKGPQLLLVSAHNSDCLQRRIDDLAEYLNKDPSSLHDLAYTLGVRREHLSHRAHKVVHPDTQLDASTFQTMKPSTNTPRVCFVFTGQGAQWAGMAQSLLSTDKSFCESIEEMDRALQALESPPLWSLKDELLKDPHLSRVNEPELSQPLCTALQISLVRVFVNLGLEPSAVAGHSSGEIAAAYAAGALTAESAITVAYYRGQLVKSLGAVGSMASIGLGIKEVTRFLKEGVTVACENSPKSVTISGDKDILNEILDDIKAEYPDTFCRRLNVSIAYHSSHMSSIGSEYENIISKYIEHGSHMLPLFSSITSEIITDPKHLDAAYWRKNLESPVLFSGAIERLLRNKEPTDIFLEIGPHSALSGPLRQIFTEFASKRIPTYIPTLVRNDHDTRSLLLSSVGYAFSCGVPVSLPALFGKGHTLTNLPPYPWRHDARFLDEGRTSRDWRLRSLPNHELLGSRIIESTDSEPAWRNMLNLDDVLWISEHVLRGEIIFPGAGYIAMAGEAVYQLHPDAEDGYTLKNVHFKTPLLLQHETTLEVITTLKPVELADGVESEWYAFTISAHDGISWTVHCKGQVRPGCGHSSKENPNAPFSRQLAPRKWYQATKRQGLDYGTSFQGLQDITADPNSTAAIATVTDSRDLHKSRYFQHPCTIDQFLQLMGVAMISGLTHRLNRAYIPAMIDSISVSSGSPKMRVEAKTRPGIRGGQIGEAVGFAENKPVFSVRGAFMMGADDPASNEAAASRLASRLYWKPDIDFLPAANLLGNPEYSVDLDESWRSSGIVAYLVIIATANRLKNAHSDSPHLMKWKEWLLNESEKLTSGHNATFLNLGIWADTIKSQNPVFLALKRVIKSYQAAAGEEQLFPGLPSWAQVDASDQEKVLEKVIDDEKDFISNDVPLSYLGEIFLSCRDFMDGKKAPLELLMKDDRWEALFEITYAQVDWGNFLELLSHSSPALRVLELGAGSGSATKEALAHLKSPGGVRMYSRYVFTDISPGFISKAQEKFKDEGRFEYCVLDITRDPEEQGFEPHSFDLIIASNVLHVTPNLSASLQKVHRLLAPDGRLLLHELNPVLPTISYIMGLLPGWWLGENDGRPDKPFVTPERWDQELRANGFTGVESVQCDGVEPYYWTASMVSRVASSPTTPRNVTLLTREEKESWCYQVAEEFQSKGYTIDWKTLEDSSECHEDVVCLLDLRDAYLRHLSSESFQTLQRFIFQNRHARFIWPTKDTNILCSDPDYSMTQGFARALRHELHLDISTLEVDYWGAKAAESLVGVHEKLHKMRELPDQDQEYEFVLSGDTLHIARSHWTSLSSERFSNVSSLHTPRDLRIRSFGRLESLQWVPQDPLLGHLEPSQVEVDINYVGLNFRDLMVSMGLVGKQEEFGLEAAGTVRKVGCEVKDFQIGDKVCMVEKGFLATRRIVDQKACFKYPDSVSPEDIAATFSVYVTAIYCLFYVGNLQKGQTILIHSAAGGVGQATISLSQLIGAEIYVTVGTEEKIQYIMDTFGIPRKRIFNSRDASFLSDLMEETNGQGVDLVINSLAGKLLHASWECVAPFGKLIELGKRDFLTHGLLSMSPFLANRTFVGVDLLHIFEQKPEMIERLKTTLFEYLEAGKIKPLRPIQVFPAYQIEDAMRYMQAGTHMGKIVIQFPSDTSLLPCPAVPGIFSLPSDTSYLLAGGLGGVGRSVSTWLVEHGARELVYLSRSGGQADEDRAFIHEIQAQGCRVICVMGSVAMYEDVEKAVSKCTNRLAGVLQMTVQLQDQTFEKMTYESWKTPLGPKVDGTWNLHHATKDMALDFFILFGSLTGIVGSGAQANYAAANSFLDVFARHRRLNGLAASVINLGVIEDIGIVSERPDYLQYAHLSSVPLLCERVVLEGLEVAIKDCASSSHHSSLSLGIGHTKAISETSTLPLWGRDARFGLYANMGSEILTKSQVNNERLRTIMTEVDQNPHLLNDVELVTEMKREIGKAIAENVLPDKELDSAQQESIAIDSLMAIEIKNWIRRIIKVEVSLKDINKAENVKGLASSLERELRAKYKLDDK